MRLIWEYSEKLNIKLINNDPKRTILGISKNAVLIVCRLFLLPFFFLENKYKDIKIAGNSITTNTADM